MSVGHGTWLWSLSAKHIKNRKTVRFGQNFVNLYYFSGAPKSGAQSAQSPTCVVGFMQIYKLHTFYFCYCFAIASHIVAFSLPSFWKPFSHHEWHFPQRRIRSLGWRPYCPCPQCRWPRTCRGPTSQTPAPSWWWWTGERWPGRDPWSDPATTARRLSSRTTEMLALMLQCHWLKT